MHHDVAGGGFERESASAAAADADASAAPAAPAASAASAAANGADQSSDNEDNQDIIPPPQNRLDADYLQGLPWKFVITKEARAEWASMQDPWRWLAVKFRHFQSFYTHAAHYVDPI